MPRIRSWQINGHIITSAHVRQWMQAVPRYAGRPNSARWWAYVKLYNVPGKIAAALAANQFDTILETAEADRSIVIRRRRKPSTIPTLRLNWPTAANDDSDLPRPQRSPTEIGLARHVERIPEAG